MVIHKLEGQAKKLSAYVGEDEHYEDKPLYQALIDQARVQGCAGATALRGLAGYGASSREEEKHGLKMSSDIPVMVSVVDEAVRITALAEMWSTMMPAGLITMEDVRVAMYCGGTDECVEVRGVE